jgi:predicted phosphoribosyltransferase
MHFVNRSEAAILLSARLENYKGQEGVVLAVPRGGVPVAYEIARRLHFALDLVMTKKIGHPRYTEYAIGAVSLEDSIVHETAGMQPEALHDIIVKIRQELKEKYHQFMGRDIPTTVQNKMVIICDDGIATGRTILAVLPMLKRQKPYRLIIAVPVISQSALKLLRQEVDEVVFLLAPTSFQGVGKFYLDFTQVEDDEVISLLK